ncbi:MAG: hypothetical protein PUC59_03975 [Firmicutes bacterium]|nr:hypothetical protein [Bacillota bacterium]
MNTTTEVIVMTDGGFPQLGLSALLEQDLSSYEYFQSLPREVQRKVEMCDVSSFAELQSYAESFRRR